MVEEIDVGVVLVDDVDTVSSSGIMESEEGVYIGTTAAATFTPEQQWEQIKTIVAPSGYEEISTPITPVPTQKQTTEPMPIHTTPTPMPQIVTPSAFDLVGIFHLLSTCQSMEELVEKTGLSESNVNDCLSILEGLGLVVTDSTGKVCGYEVVRTLSDKFTKIGISIQ